jgi:hypothetical protein
VRRVVAVTLLGALAAPAIARGQERDPREGEAQRACLTGDSQRGIDLLAQLYIASDDVNYLYNQGRCLQQNGRFAEAIPRFREYLRKVKEPTAAEVADAEKQISECQRLASPPAAPPALVPQGELRGSASRADSEARSRRIGGVLVAIGAVGLVGALAAGLAVESFEQDVNRQYDPTKHRWGGRLEALQWAGYGLGALGLGLGATFWVAGRPSAGGAAGVAWRSRF